MTSAAAALFATTASRRLGGPLLTLPNQVTLSRALAAALLAASSVRTPSRLLRRLAFTGLLAAVTAADWIDGPLARRAGPTRLGALLDLEADSWLTLWAAVAGRCWGGLPALVMVAPVARYGVRALIPAYPGNSGWQRAAGVAQMVALCGALAPWERPAAAARRLAPIAAAAQFASLARDAVR